ncbi:MAG: hypothetical protein HKP41_04865 [Desulfobacterales bacterium]|nr:hypothetical protein [Deltaproteobacteria bacterium]NNK93666.1 hypothetical protein [Desulfobacterales bacterium]
MSKDQLTRNGTSVILRGTNTLKQPNSTIGKVMIRKILISASAGICLFFYTTTAFSATCSLPSGVEKGSNYVVGTTISTPAQHIYFEIRLVDFDYKNCWLIGVYTSGIARGKHVYISMDKIVAIIEQ